ncbi:unnamed protein product [Lactuca saligna]|uniref:Uncharacterized protein n=1 Tax=Lactuca saligna TaxID=75948 RepID=A0AA35XZE2_LACSI|nr:unnamed protein product [Lactuca saligna]
MWWFWPHYGVSGSSALPKQGETEKTKKNPRQSKRLKNMNKNRRLTIKRVMKLLHQTKEKTKLLNMLRKELEAQETEAEIVKITLETHNSLIPPWSINRTQKEAIDDPSVYWLEPTVSFELNTEAYSQFDFPITPMDFFLFHCFEVIEKALIFNKVMNLKLFNFYLKYAKPQYRTWSLKRIMGLKVCLPAPTEDFVNIKFKDFEGSIKF